MKDKVKMRYPFVPGFRKGPRTHIGRDKLHLYASSDNMERAEDGRPVYFHTWTQWHPCGHTCRGQRGFDIAQDADEMEGGQAGREAWHKQVDALKLQAAVEARRLQGTGSGW